MTINNKESLLWFPSTGGRRNERIRAKKPEQTRETVRQRSAVELDDQYWSKAVQTGTRLRPFETNERADGNQKEALSNSRKFHECISRITFCAVNEKTDLNKTPAWWQRGKTLDPSNP